MARSARPTDLRTWLREKFEAIDDRLRRLEAPMGDQLYNALAKVQELIANIGTYVDAYLASGFTTGSMHATGNVTIDGATTSTGGLNSIDVYNRVVTGTGSYHIVYANSAGQLGQVPSSRRFKRDITSADLDFDSMQKLRMVTYRYLVAVESMGDEAPNEIGLIAEEVDSLGLHWLVNYDDAGLPFGINERALLFATLALALRANESPTA